MKSDDMLKMTAGIILVPIVASIVISGVKGSIIAVGSLIEHIKYKRKIKKGLKDGSIVKIDGQYYEVHTEEEA